MTKKIFRFPRLSTPSGELRRLEQILRATYSRMKKAKVLVSRTRGFDIYSTKYGEDMERNFIFLADTLAKEKIDPSLYLKVLAKYGKFEDSNVVPPYQWLANPKTLDIFYWLVEKERSKFVRHEDWKRHLEDPGHVSPDRIKLSMKKSRLVIQETIERFGLSIGEAAIIQVTSLSPWFLCLCVGFQTLGGMDLLEEGEQLIVVHCLTHLIENKKSLKVALSEYAKL